MIEQITAQQHKDGCECCHEQRHPCDEYERLLIANVEQLTKERDEHQKRREYAEQMRAISNDIKKRAEGQLNRAREEIKKLEGEILDCPADDAYHASLKKHKEKEPTPVKVQRTKSRQRCCYTDYEDGCPHDSQPKKPPACERISGQKLEGFSIVPYCNRHGCYWPDESVAGNCPVRTAEIREVWNRARQLEREPSS